MSAAAMKECPFCAETIKAAAVLCRFCGRDLPAPLDTSSPAQEPAVSRPRLRRDEIFDLLTALVEKSLIVYEEDEQGHGRYRLLEMVRQYARDRLRETGEVEEVRRRHRDWYLGFVERAEPELSREHQAEWLEQLETDHDNLRAALEWSVERDESPEVMQLTGVLSEFWMVRGYVTEGRQRIDTVLAMAAVQGHPAARAKALQEAGRLAWRQGDYLAAREHLGECLAISRGMGDDQTVAGVLLLLAAIANARSDYRAACSLTEERLAICRRLGDRNGIAVSLHALAIWVKFQDELAKAWALCEESLAISRELGDTGAIARKLHELGSVALCQGEFARAQPLLEESLAMHRNLGHRIDASWSLHFLGDVAFYQGQYPRARALYEESLALRHAVGDQFAVSWSFLRLADIALIEGDLAGAGSLLTDCVAIRSRLGDRRGLAECLERFARTALAAGQPERAAWLLGAAGALREEIGAPLPPADSPACEKMVATIQAAVSEEAFEAAWAEGKAMPWEEALASALATPHED